MEITGNGKVFRVSGSDAGGFCVYWRNESEKHSYVIGSRRNARTWKTREGAQKFAQDLADGKRDIPQSF